MENNLSISNSTYSELVSNPLADINAVIEWFASCQDRSASTRDLYARTIAGFFHWVMAEGKQTRNLRTSDIVEYKEYLFREGKTSLTVASYLNSVRRFFAWTERNGVFPNIAADVHAPGRKQEFKKQALTVKKAVELLRYAESLSARDRAIINLMARTGLRCIEVARANIGDIAYKVVGDDNRRVLLVQGKGCSEKDNFVILDDDAYKPLAEYLASRKGEPSGAPLFASTSNHTAKAEKHAHDTDYNARRLSTRAISSTVKEALKAVGLDGHEFTAHSLRHTVGTNILRAGGTLEQAQMTLRHANPATTEIYARMALQERRFTNGGEALISSLYAGAMA